ncbi:MAG: hypothetical protein FWD53_03485 [Phycisphaerales bacterium]|nr:hypothetical protein [Phycisphaerales bacterium]
MPFRVMTIGLAGASSFKSRPPRTSIRPEPFCLELYKRTKDQVMGWNNSGHAIRAVDAIFQIPTISTEAFFVQSKIPRRSLSRFLNLLRDKKILTTVQEAKGRREGVYAFRELLDMLEDK